MGTKSKHSTKKATKRRRFQVISLPAPGEARERGLPDSLHHEMTHAKR